MYLGSHYTGKKAELDNPPEQATFYQESPYWGGDTAVYAEPWGGQQLNVAPQVNGDIEMDPAITLMQGDRPEMDTTFHTQPNKSAGENPSDAPAWGAPWGEGESRPPVQGVGGIDPTTDGVKTMPQGLGPDGYAVGDGQPPFPIGDGSVHETDMGDPWNSPAGPGIVQAGQGARGGECHMDYGAAIEATQRKLNPEDAEANMLEAMYKKLADEAAVMRITADPEVVQASIVADSQDIIKVASEDMLFSFTRSASNPNVLIHRSSNELWEADTDEEGNMILRRAFNPSSIIPG